MLRWASDQAASSISNDTIHDLLAALAGATERGVVVYDRRGRREEERSWADLLQRSHGAGQGLLAGGCEPGDHVFLQLPNSYQLIEGFLGAIAVGLVPCCLAPPRALRGVDGFRERMQLLLSQCPRSRLVASQEVGDAAGVPYMPPPDDAVVATPTAPPRDVDPESIAFVQLTSGSTRHPKIVRISHRALLATVRAICESGENTSDESNVSWLPLYHDMGLVGGLLAAMFVRSSLHLMRPETFLSRPRTWLQTISGVPGPVISAAPNFAYQHCVRTVGAGDLQGLDLSRWRIAACGAERVRAEVLDEFATHFAPVGFRPEIFVPCYGLAETTLAVTFGPGKSVPVVDDGNVSCGRPIPGTEVAIQDSDGGSLPDGQQGEITVRSPGVFSGYVGDEHDSGIRAGWLHTGDRGYLRDGELFITGRYKDLVIVDGVNIDPDEIEAIADRCVAVVGGRSAAFAVEVDRRERAVLVVEATSGDAETFAGWNRAVGDGVARTFGFKLYDMVFVRRGSMSKTTSGKVQRSQVCEAFQQGNLESLWRQRDEAVEKSPRC